jgi:hypothetical protein
MLGRTETSDSHPKREDCPTLFSTYVLSQHCLGPTYGLLSYCTLGVHEMLGCRAILSNYDLSTFDYIVFVQFPY